MTIGGRGYGVAMSLLAAYLLAGCNDTRRNWASCHHEECKLGYVCTDDKRCVLAPDDNVPDGGPVARFDGAPPLTVDVAEDTAAPALDATDNDVAAPDAALDIAGTIIDSTAGVGPDASIDSTVGGSLDRALEVAIDASPDRAMDTWVPDAPGTCSSDDDCTGTTPACVDNRCVECSKHDHCALPTKPICAANLCQACTDDEQCAELVPAGPGVCMSHLDGRCATEAETIYIGSNGTATCSDVAPSAGSARSPYCSVQNGVLAARSKGKYLVVLSGALLGGFSGISFTTPLTVVGKDAVITASEASDGISIASGEIYLRGVKVMGSVAGQTRLGINAQATSGSSLTLHLDGCSISGNPGGGILLAGAAFDIRNSVISDNGAGQTSSGATFGGIRVDSLPASGSAALTLVTIINNEGPGLSCAASIQGSGVLATGNGLMEIAGDCGLEPCKSASTTCGAQR